MDTCWPIDDFTAELAALGRSPGTIRLRAYYVRRFAARHPDPWAVTRADVVAAIAGGKPETRKSYRASLRSFYLWAVRAGLTDVDPTLAVRLPVPRPVARACPEDVISRARAFAGADTALMVWLAAEAGLRRMEVAGLHSDDLAGDWLHIVGKGGHRRYVPIGPDLRDALAGRPAGFVFPSPYGGHLSPDCVGRRISRALGPRWTAHTLRHRYATVGFTTTHDLLAVQQNLGHASVATTQRYIAIPDDARRACSAAAALPRLRAV